ncbi:hypothetical protein ACTFIW_002200 [Dictyostelium discoideum]
MQLNEFQLIFLDQFQILIEEVILSGDIELVKMVFESLPSPTCNTSVIELIKSPLMFDYIKNQLEKLSRPSENSVYFDQIISNHKIANHFKNNYYQQYILFSRNDISTIEFLINSRQQLQQND